MKVQSVSGRSPANSESNTARRQLSMMMPVRCSKDSGRNPVAEATPSLSSVQESIDRSTKQELSRADIERHQADATSEKHSIVGTRPASTAMVGFVWALAAEKLTGLSVMEQLFNPATSGLLWFAAVVQLFTLASIIPFANGESTDARRWGPFNAKAERWNGRLAMIGFAALVIDEMIRQGPLIHP
ncbi:hypothetical protein L7F22_048897 [Adiantum nelumboides]|nr:hypothetical protein [Adiantum nelumboides]